MAFSLRLCHVLNENYKSHNIAIRIVSTIQSKKALMCLRKRAQTILVNNVRPVRPDLVRLLPYAQKRGSSATESKMADSLVTSSLGIIVNLEIGRPEYAIRYLSRDHKIVSTTVYRKPFTNK